MCIFVLLCVMWFVVSRSRSSRRGNYRGDVNSYYFCVFLILFWFMYLCFWMFVLMCVFYFFVFVFLCLLLLMCCLCFCVLVVCCYCEVVLILWWIYVCLCLWLLFLCVFVCVWVCLLCFEVCLWVLDCVVCVWMMIRSFCYVIIVRVVERARTNVFWFVCIVNLGKYIVCECCEKKCVCVCVNCVFVNYVFLVVGLFNLTRFTSASCSFINRAINFFDVFCRCFVMNILFNM